ncbi:DUF5004 domain-containing protein [Chitinophaga sancti]|uniref:DUF5004 domain-containing protein n=1 Tax=Chitinophaga sancti TaxID=1004 RepID=A0A1K1SJ77_9BACT|nr:DUF5004 domain-containing protein [Chitinophaga sancti]WQD64469.1 DUF5004 domain-containing protein [Chitinophaga sancti]WQG89907.1 DUF5004 domain-containing protein [Chitinophaga sancti]SFW84403.1 Lipocalin-like domain [Chitinophaga sancti]
MNRYLILSAFCLLLFSCKLEEVSPVGEAPKNISGSWKVLKATRNGTDITSAFDFTQFRVKFDSAGNYSIVNKIPFLVNTNGTYSLDDPAYPFKITFTPQGGSAVATSFNYVTAAGIRQLNLTFVPGCELNAYIYTLQKDN